MVQHLSTYFNGPLGATHGWKRRDEPVSHSSDREKFMALVDEHGAALLALLRRLCGNRDDADDLFQETAVRVWRNFATKPVLRNPRGWLMTIAYRTFIDCQARRVRPERLKDPADQPEAMPGPGELAEQAEACDRVQAAIAGLPGPIRDVVSLHYIGGLSLSQTAAAMEIPVGTIKSRLCTALTRLRSVLE